MFNLSVVDTDEFLMMPSTARLLYYDLGMRADDDGFVDDWRKILLFTKATEDDMKILVAKSYVIPFESGIIVIRHWRLNNYLQKDRTTETIHQKEKAQLLLDENNVYTLDTTCIHSIDKNRLDKNSIDNIYINNIHQQKSIDEVHFVNFNEEFDEIWSNYPKKQGKKDALKHYIKSRKKGVDKETIEMGLNNYLEYIKKNNIDARYIKQGSTWFNQECWNDDYSIKKETTTKDIAEHYNFEEFR